MGERSETEEGEESERGVRKVRSEGIERRVKGVRQRERK